MKKALVVFLILAVAGGLFAQSVSTKGSVQAGIGIGFTDEDGNEPKVDYIRDRGGQGLRGQVDITFNSADDAAYGTYGAQVSVRGVHSKFVASDWAVSIPEAKLWWNPSSMLRIDLGNGGPGGMNTPAAMDANLNVLDGDGLKVRLIPIADLTLGATALYGKSDKLFKDMNYALGAKYTVPSLLTAVANFKFDPTKTDEAVGGKIALAAGANFLGLSGMGLSKIAADVQTFNFGGDGAYLGIGQAINFATGALSLGASAKELIWIGKDSPDFIPMRFQGELSYKVTPIVTPAVEVRYVMGNKPALTNFQKAGDVVDAGWGAKDQAALGISPRVTFAVGPTITLGYNLQMDLSEGASGKTMTHLIYAGVDINF